MKILFLKFGWVINMPKNKKRPDGRLQSKVYLGVYDGEKQYKYVYGKTQKEVDEKVLALKLSLRKGINVGAQSDTFEEWAERWLSFKKLEVSHNWFKTICALVDNLESLYNMPISKIKTFDLQLLMNSLATIPREQTGKLYSNASLKHIKMIISAVFQLAIENRIIDYNPVTAVKIPKASEAVPRRALNETEREWIIDTPHRAQRAAMIMMFSGLRRGELIPLTWTDIDFENKTITVNKAVEMIDGKPVVKYKTKSKAGMRTIFIPNLLIDFLKSEKKTSLLVCPSVRGSMMSDSAWKKLWESYLIDLNLKYGDFNQLVETKGKTPNKFSPKKTPLLIPKFTAHWLRHTYITLLYFSGVDILTAKEQAGHSDIKTTMSIYTHLDSNYKIKSMQKLDDFLAEKGSASKVSWVSEGVSY
jgi:integrase